MSTEIQKYEEEADEVKASLAKIQIDGPAAYTQAAEFLTQVKGTLKRIEAERVEITKPLRESLEKTNSFFSRVAAKYNAAEKDLKEKIAAFVEAGKKEEVRLLAEYAQNPESSSSALVLASQALPVVPGVSTRTTYTWELENAAKVPDEFWCLDEKAIGAYVRANPGRAPDGIRAIPKTTVAASAN